MAQVIDFACAERSLVSPLVWLMEKGTCGYRKACDDAVLKGSGMQARGEYGTVILSFLQEEKEKYLPLTTGFFEQKKQIIQEVRDKLWILERRKKDFYLLYLQLQLQFIV